MPDIQITLTAGQLPEGFCPINEQQRLDTYVENIAASISEEFSTIIVSSSQPTVDEQDGLWAKVNADNSLIGIFTFSGGAWIRPHEIPAGPNGFRALWMGTTTELETYDGGSAGAVTPTTGPFWEVDTDFAGKIPRGADGTVPVATNGNELASGASATDQVRGAYFIKRTSRVYRTS